MKKRILSIVLALCMVMAFMPQAVFAEEPTGSLAITVNGFQVGKTPNDCTYTFNSTIPGITFSEDDIQYIRWDKYVADGDRYSISNTDAFQAGTQYRLVINLNNNGLTEVPAVTVNGNTPDYCTLPYFGGVPEALNIGCDLGTPALPQITIDGPDVVCAQQDYEFTVTPSGGVTLDETFGYDTGRMGSGADLTLDEAGVGHGVVRKEWYDPNTNCFDVIAHGTTADGTSVSTAKHVEVSQEHIYVDGVCGCGAVLTYIVQYDGGAEFGLCVDFKTYGEDLTLRGETFQRDGYVQTGWVDKESGDVYGLGDVYTTDADVTLNPVWDEIITLTVPFTTTVKLGGDVAPGETTFGLEIVGNNAGGADISDVTVSGSVTTNGAGEYNGTLTLTGPSGLLRNLLCEGAFVQQVDAGEEGWTVDDTVYGLLWWGGAELTVDDDAAENTVLIFPAICEGDDDGVYYVLDDDDGPLDEMSFTNTYTAHVYELKHDATSHWDECDCGDVQNKEAHKYGDWTVTKEATETAVGEKEHICTVCGYTQTAEIAKLPSSDTTKPTESNPNTGATTNPQTGDNSNLFLWIALLFAGGFGVIGTGVYSKRRRSSRAK